MSDESRDCEVVGTAIVLFLTRMRFELATGVYNPEYASVPGKWRNGRNHESLARHHSYRIRRSGGIRFRDKRSRSAHSTQPPRY
jgi:hypothetical protein